MSEELPPVSDQIEIGPEGFPVNGWRVDLEDFDRLLAECSDVDWQDAVGGLYAAPVELDRRWLRTENQGSVGSCQGQSSSEVGEVNYHIASGGKTIQFSAQWMYVESQKFDGISGDRGSTLWGGAKVMQQKGFCPESLWTYTGRYDRTPPSGDYQACINAASGFKLKTIVQLKSHAQIVTFLGSGLGSVWIGRRVDWGGGHATHLAGYKRPDAHGRNPLDEHNSWGPNWMEKGWKVRSPEEVDSWFKDSYTVALGASDMQVDQLKPRPVDFSKNSPLFD